MTLTCNTTLSPHINSSDVQFIFYRDERKVQEFNMSNKYEVQSVHLEDSGNYTCEVKTSTNKAMRRSSGLYILIAGAAIRPAVTFSPNYRKIFTTESITMTCDGGSAIGEGVTYIWYKDNSSVYNGKYYTIRSAKTSHSGNYQCQTRPGEISDPARLDVSDGRVILQTPLHVYEGDEITIRCHHNPGYGGGRTIFYKGYSVIRALSDNAEYYIGNVDRTTAGTYRCRKEVQYVSQFFEDQVFVSVQGK
ncbi:high affinity immunoglobulin gamma Fc receptor, partial [Pristimantis euphronides]